MAGKAHLFYVQNVGVIGSVILLALASTVTISFLVIHVNKGKISSCGRNA